MKHAIEWLEAMIKSINNTIKFEEEEIANHEAGVLEHFKSLNLWKEKQEDYKKAIKKLKEGEDV